LHARYERVRSKTSLRPNQALGTLSSYYLSSEETMVYNALQTSLQRRFPQCRVDLHYTLRKMMATASEFAIRQ
jgi:hypothetical protein